MKRYRLYIDESGSSHSGNWKTSPYYVLIGCIIEERHQQDLKTLADQIKFKYWGHTNIVFHSADIAKNMKDFIIFNGNASLELKFLADLYNLLTGAHVEITASVVDKQLVFAKQWTEKRVIRETASSVMKDFVSYVFAHRNSNGRMIFEASTGLKDQTYLELFDYYLSPNFVRKDKDFQNVREQLTSISFVTKQNHDTETQISDIFAYAAKCKYERDFKKSSFTVNSYESKVIKILESKLIKMPPNVGAEKKKYLKKIKPFEVIK